MPGMAKGIFKFELGAHAKDIITGIEGVLTGRVEYLTGCTQYVLQPTGTDKEGKIKDSYWLDEGRLDLLPKKAPIAMRPAPAGGPPPTAKRTTPRRV